MFPYRLARALTAVRTARARPALSSLHAQWYFNDRLVFRIDPTLLRRRLLDRVRLEGAEFWLSDRFLDGGDWGDVVRPIEQFAEHRDMVELVSFGARYREMPVFRELSDRIGSGQPARRYGKVLDSEAKLHAYFGYFLQLIESIRERGFQAQSELPRGRSEGIEVRGKWAARQRNIGVAIAADGEVLRFLGGRHRTAIAQALGIPAVPVEVRLVHAEWLAAQVDRTNLPANQALLGWVSLR